MWRQILASLTGMVLSWSPVSGIQQMAVYTPARTVVVEEKDPNLHYGREAVLMAMEEVIRVLVDEYYKRYGGLFVTRGFVERKVREEFRNRKDEILRLIEQKYMRDGLAVQFNSRTSQVTYSESRCLRTATVKEIAGSIIELRSELKKNS